MVINILRKTITGSDHNVNVFGILRELNTFRHPLLAIAILALTIFLVWFLISLVLSFIYFFYLKIKK